MALASYFLEIAQTYDRTLGLGAPVQQRLKEAGSALVEHTPPGILVQGSGGKGLATFTPWVGFFDPDETTSPQKGLYVVYLFSEDLQTLNLSLNQGIEELRRELGDRRARERLAVDAAAIRDRIVDLNTSGFVPVMDLDSGGARQRAYEAGNIWCRPYSIVELPGDADLDSDLQAMLDLYEAAVVAKRELLITDPGAISTPSSPTPDDEGTDLLRNFKPKSDADYVSRLVGRKLTKTRRHERLVAQYGVWVSGQGVAPSTTEHPKDLVLRKGTHEWLVEAKVVRNGNATQAVREAIGQLFTYRHLLYDSPADVNLVALFSETVGDVYVDLLEMLGIGAVWFEDGLWKGSSSAEAGGLTSP